MSEYNLISQAFNVSISANVPAASGFNYDNILVNHPVGFSSTDSTKSFSTIKTDELLGHYIDFTFDYDYRISRVIIEACQDGSTTCGTDGYKMSVNVLDSNDALVHKCKSINNAGHHHNVNCANNKGTGKMGRKLRL